MTELNLKKMTADVLNAQEQAAEIKENLSWPHDYPLYFVEKIISELHRIHFKEASHIQERIEYWNQVKNELSKRCNL